MIMCQENLENLKRLFSTIIIIIFLVKCPKVKCPSHCPNGLNVVKDPRYKCNYCVCGKYKVNKSNHTLSISRKF